MADPSSLRDEELIVLRLHTVEGSQDSSFPNTYYETAQCQDCGAHWRYTRDSDVGGKGSYLTRV